MTASILSAMACDQSHDLADKCDVIIQQDQVYLISKLSLMSKNAVGSGAHKDCL